MTTHAVRRRNTMLSALKTWTWAGLLGMAALFSLALAPAPVSISLAPTIAPATPATSSLKAARPRSPQDSPPPQVSDAEREAIEGMLHRYRRAIAEDNATVFAACFDVTRLVDEVGHLDMLPDLNAEERGEFEGGLKQAIRQSWLPRSSGDAEWISHKVHSIIAMEAPNEALVYVRARNTLGLNIKTRLWLIKKTRGWAIYDFEDLDFGTRCTLSLGLALSGGQMRVAPWVRHGPEIQEAFQMVLNGDLAGGRQLADELAAAGFPPAFEVMRLNVLIAVHLVERDYNLADRANEQAAQLVPNQPAADFNRGAVYVGLERYQEAIEAIKRYVAILGHDDDTYATLGDAYQGLGDHATAWEHYQLALDDYPDNYQAMTGMVLLTELQGPKHAADRLKRANAPDILFRDVANQLEAAETGDATRALAEFAGHVRSITPENPEAAYYEGSALANLGHYQEAATILETALDRAPADERWAYVELYAYAMHESGHPLEAYDQVAGDGAVFEFLADELVDDENADRLETLVQRHATHDPADIMLPYYEGHVHLLREEFAAAEQAYRRGLIPELDDVWRGYYRYAIGWVAYLDNRGIDAVTDVVPRDDMAWWYASWSWNDGDDEALAGAIAVYAPDHADSLSLLRWRARLHWLRAEYDSVVDHVDALNHRHLELVHAEAAFDDEPDSETERLHFRSLLRLDRLDEALEVAIASTARDGDPYFEVIAYAMARRVRETEAAFARCVEFGYLPEDFFGDEDAAPILARPIFAPLRKRFQPAAPADDPADSDNA